MPLFADLNKHEIQEIARLFKEHRFAKGETIVQEGSTGDTLFLIESGEAGVFIGGRGRTTMKSPDHFGEVAMVDEGTRMATICASSEVVCYGLTCRDFHALVEKNGVVGWKRPAIILEADGRWYVGPGNGLFELVQRRAAKTRSWDIDWKPERLSASFHGRDLFAPVAAILARGEPPPGRPRNDDADRREDLAGRPRRDRVP